MLDGYLGIARRIQNDTNNNQTTSGKVDNSGSVLPIQVVWLLMILCTWGIIVNSLGLYVINLSFTLKEGARWLIMVSFCDLLICVWILPFEIYGLQYIGTTDTPYGLCFLLTLTGSWISWLLLLILLTASVSVLGRCLVRRFPRMNTHNVSVMLGVNILMALLLSLGAMTVRSTGLLFYSQSDNPAKAPEKRITCVLREAMLLEATGNAASVVNILRLTMLLALFAVTVAASVVLFFTRKGLNDVGVDHDDDRDYFYQYDHYPDQDYGYGMDVVPTASTIIDKLRLMKAVDTVVDNTPKPSLEDDSCLKTQVQQLLEAEVELIEMVFELYLSDQSVSFAQNTLLRKRLSVHPSKLGGTRASLLQARLSFAPGSSLSVPKVSGYSARESVSMPAITETHTPPNSSVTSLKGAISHTGGTSTDSGSQKKKSARFLAPSTPPERSGGLSVPSAQARKSILTFADLPQSAKWRKSTIAFADLPQSAKGRKSTLAFADLPRSAQARKSTLAFAGTLPRKSTLAVAGTLPRKSTLAFADLHATPPDKTPHSRSGIALLFSSTLKDSLNKPSTNSARGGRSFKLCSCLSDRSEQQQAARVNTTRPSLFVSNQSMMSFNEGGYYPSRKATSLPDLTSDAYFGDTSCNVDMQVQAALAYVHAPEDMQDNLRKEMLFQRALSNFLQFGYKLGRGATDLAPVRRASDSVLISMASEALDCTMSEYVVNHDYYHGAFYDDQLYDYDDDNDHDQHPYEGGKPRIEYSIMTMIIAAVVLLLISQLPLCFVKFKHEVTLELLKSPKAALDTYVWTEIVHLHAILKPLFYFLFVPKFRFRFLLLFCGYCCEKHLRDRK